jgi:hypothetical protein
MILPEQTRTRVVREAGRQQARRSKARGAGSVATATRQRPVNQVNAGIFGGIRDALVGGAVGLVTGGPAGAIAGAGAGFARGFAEDAPQKSTPTSLVGTDCPSGFRRNSLGQCVQLVPEPGFGPFLERALPFGGTGMTEGGGTAVRGSFGLPAIEPQLLSTVKHRCPTGFVLGKDNLCYPRAVLGRRSNFRKWKGAKRPPVSAADARALAKIDRIRDKVKELGKRADLSVKAKSSRR